MQLLILGAGRFAQDVADWAAEIPGVVPVGFYQNEGPDTQTALDGFSVLSESEFRDRLTTCQVVCAVGSPRRTEFIEKAAGWGAVFSTLVHPTARVSSKASLAPGTIIAPLATVAAHARLASHVIVNRGASIGHHVAIGDYSTIGPGAIVAGSAAIGRGVLIGAGAVLKDAVVVGDRATVSIGSVVIRDVNGGSKVLGNPARRLPPG